MAKRKKIALESVLKPDENIYWEGKSERLPYLLSEIKDDIPELVLRIIFDLILIPVLFLNTTSEFGVITKIVLIMLWLWHLKPILLILSKPGLKSLEWKNTFYNITDKNIYMQFGTNQVYY